MTSDLSLTLSAVVCAIRDEAPIVLTIPTPDEAEGLPSGPFVPDRDRTLEAGLRRLVGEQTELSLGHVEQLYTFGDRGRERLGEGNVVSVGYLALAGPDSPRPGWRSFYAAFPWEDWRAGEPAVAAALHDALGRWAARDHQRQARVASTIGSPALPWDEERVLERYELFYEAGLVREAVADGRAEPHPLMERTGRAMAFDHRRILATALARLRAKAKYRPVVFELMPDTFSLTELQRTVETIFGRAVHKGNFRRLVETAQLVEPSGGTARGGSGRPARLYRFRRAVLGERTAAGLRVR